MTIIIADHVSLIKTPDFWDPEKAYQNYSPDLEGAKKEGAALKLESFRKLEGKGIKNAMMITDGQQDFRDNGRLAVMGMDNGVLKTCARIINGVYAGYYTGLIYSLDQHHPFHISSGLYWYDKDENPMDLSGSYKAAQLYEILDRDMGIFKARVFESDGTPKDYSYFRSVNNDKIQNKDEETVLDTVDYFESLRDSGQGPIWVFAEHCKIGTDGMSLHPLIAETIEWACAARKIQPHVIWKGHIANTDWFGPFRPCRVDNSHPDGQLKKYVLDSMKHYNNIDFVGWAEDFCDYYAKNQVLKYMQDTEHIEKLVFVKDCTSPIVPDTEHVIKQNEEAEKKGVRFITHDEAFNL